MNRESNIFLVGPLGAGKSSVGKCLANSLKVDFYDIDRLIEQRTGVDLSWIFDVEGEDKFRERETAVLQEISKRSNIILATGGGTVLSEENRNLMKARGIVIYLKTELQQQYKRTQFNKYNRPLLRGDNVKKRLQALADERGHLYREIADKEFITDNRAVRSVANEILRHIKEIKQM